MFGEEKVKAVRAALSAIDKLEYPKAVYELKLHEAQELSEQVALAKIELGNRFNELPKNNVGRPKEIIDTPVDNLKSKSEVIAKLGFTQKQAERFQQMAKNPDVVQSAMAKAREQKLREGQEIGKLVLLAEARLGELFNQMPKVGVGGNGSNQYKQAIIPPEGNNSSDEDADEEEPPLKPKLEVAAQMVIDDRADAKIWILKNQLGRRNLIPPVRIKLALLVEDEIAAQAKKNSLANLKQNTELDICPTRATLNDSQKQDWRAKRETSTNNQLAKMAGENVQLCISLRETLKAR